ncbi:hypothetical protein Bca52824_068945 [Brassica carinata]|uniref:Uncharacterized protein n=1 Tax=Brassica carinata TaxID=52824 RepID=A0A8X7Q1F8_BRACI|nr:hypothetical protein Bca52824_068945 [Brassica carinata]
MGRKRNKKGAKDDVNAAEVAMEKAVRRVQEILRDHSEQEIRATLLQCNLNHNQGASIQLTDSSTTTSSVLVPNQSAITNGVTKGVPISSTEAAPSLPVPSSSEQWMYLASNMPCPYLCGDVKNGETRTVSISSPEAIPPLPVPSSRALTNLKPNRQDTRMITASGLPMDEPSKQNVTKAPVKSDSPLHQKPDATNPVSNSFTESDAARDPQNSAFLRNARQSIATASLLGPRPLPSMADAFGTYPSSKPHTNNQQAMNSQGQVPSGQYGNMINSPYWRPNQNESYNMAPFQQRGGGSNSNTLAHHGNMMTSPYMWLEPDDDTSIYQSLDSVFAPYRNRTLPMSATSTVPSSHGSAYGVGMLSGNAANSRFGYGDVSRNHLPSNSSGTSSIGSSSNRSAFGFNMTSGNGSNSWLGYEDISGTISPSNSSGTSRVPSSHGSDYGRGMSSGNGSNSRLGYEEDISRIHMPSIQGRSPFVWRSVQGEDSYGSIRPHNQQQREAYFERIRADLASSLDQEYINRRDQTQQRPRDK